MKINYLFCISVLILFIGLFSSCASRKDIVYFQNIDDLAAMDSIYQNNTIIQPNDLLNITVTAADPQAVRPYNLVTESRPPADAYQASSNTRQLGYLVDNDGNIEFPELGTIKVIGLSRKELIDYLVLRISEGVLNPIVNISILNFKVSVLGEVARPNVYGVSGERVTLVEALALAGDLTIFGKRQNILILRDTDGEKKHERVDITQADFINSDYYYLQQNDVVYVEPNNPRVQNSISNPNAARYISILSLALSVFLIFYRR